MDLRPIGLPDALDILEWRNDPLTRAMSRNQSIIETESHLAWFRDFLADDGRIGWLAQRQGHKLGWVRFAHITDGANSGAWDVGIALNPSHRGQGLGGALLNAGVALFDQTRPGSKLLATIRAGNPASRKIFAACQFQWVDRKGDWDHFVRP